MTKFMHASSEGAQPSAAVTDTFRSPEGQIPLDRLYAALSAAPKKTNRRVLRSHVQLDGADDTDVDQNNLADDADVEHSIPVDDAPGPITTQPLSTGSAALANAHSLEDQIAQYTAMLDAANAVFDTEHSL